MPPHRSPKLLVHRLHQTLSLTLVLLVPIAAIAFATWCRT